MTTNIYDRFCEQNNDEKSGWKLKTPWTTNSKPRPRQVNNVAEIITNLVYMNKLFFPQFSYVFLQETVKNSKVIVIIIIGIL